MCMQTKKILREGNAGEPTFLNTLNIDLECAVQIFPVYVLLHSIFRLVTTAS